MQGPVFAEGQWPLEGKIKKGVIESCGATCTSGSVAKTGPLASALYVIESAADGARLHFPPSFKLRAISSSDARETANGVVSGRTITS